MKRWSNKLGDSINFSIDKTSEKTFLENFFIDRAFVPQNEQEQKEFEDFSFISSAMALAVYIASADDDISSEEKAGILDEIFFQLHHNSREYELISEEFDAKDKELVNKLFENYKNELAQNVFNLDHILALINKFYEKNPYKKNYLIRFCYIIAYTESRNVEKELARTEQLAIKLGVDPENNQRLKAEAQEQVNS